MKDFADFRKYVIGNDSIHRKIADKVRSKENEIPLDEQNDEDHMRAWVEIGSLTLLEEYHNWLNS